jgi:cysteine dioxygenase
MEVVESLNTESTISETVEIEELLARQDAENVPVPADLTELIKLLHETFAHDSVNVDYVMKLLENYKSNEKDWRQYAKYDPHKYTRNLIDAGNGKFNILLLCWAELQGSPIHDHAGSHCFMKCLHGELCETQYEWPESNQEDSKAEMKEIGKKPLRKNEVCYMNDSIGLHRVGNPSETVPAVTLHVYVPGYDECRIFDQQTSRANTVKITFYSKYGEKVVNN